MLYITRILYVLCAIVNGAFTDASYDIREEIWKLKEITADLQRTIEAQNTKIAEQNVNISNQDRLIMEHQMNTAVQGNNALQTQNRLLERVVDVTEWRNEYKNVSLSQDVRLQGMERELLDIASQVTRLQTIQQNVSELEAGIARQGDPVAFMARLSNDSIKGSNNPYDRITFDDIVTNVGGAYNSSRGVFICPSDGVYFFVWTILQFRRQPAYTLLMMNGTIVVENHAESLVGIRTTSTATSTLNLLKGSEVEIRWSDQSRGQIHGSVYSSFQGFKVA